MARRPNYGVEKRRKEIQRQKKKDKKDEKKRLKKEGETSDEQGVELYGDDGETGTAGAELDEGDSNADD
jgi:hypothetical protein